MIKKHGKDYYIKEMEASQKSGFNTNLLLAKISSNDNKSQISSKFKEEGLLADD